MSDRENNIVEIGATPEFFMPNAAHVFVVFYTNNVPLSPPELQVYWWLPRFNFMPIPNSIVLRVRDRPSSSEYFFCTLSVWIGGRGAPWVQDGESFHAVVPILSDENHVCLGAPTSSASPAAPAETRIVVPTETRVINRWVESDMQIVSQCVQPPRSGAPPSNSPILDVVAMLDRCSAP